MQSIIKKKEKKEEFHEIGLFDEFGFRFLCLGFSS